MITNTPEHVQQKNWIHMAVTFHCVQCENTENHCFCTCYFLTYLLSYLLTPWSRVLLEKL